MAHSIFRTEPRTAPEVIADARRHLAAYRAVDPESDQAVVAAWHLSRDLADLLALTATDAAA